MGNHASGERRGKLGDPYPIPGQPPSIDRHRHPRPLVSQSSEEDQPPTFGKFSMSPTDGKGTVISSQAAIPVIKGDTKVMPCVIKWAGGGKDVSIAGTFNQWQPIPMVKSEKDFVLILDLPVGEHEYKFKVDGDWKVNPNEKACSNPLGTDNNILSVKESDFEEMESGLLKDPNDKNEILDKDDFGQVTPPANAPMENRRICPPSLPPHLQQVILNKDTPVSCEPTLLPEPNHVMLNHLFALSIHNGIMVLSTTNRYKKKSVTTLIYRPI